jgi:hypothetical protein
MSDDRSERLRRRRGEAKDKATERAETDEPSEPSKDSESSKPSESGDGGGVAESSETDEPSETSETDESGQEPVKSELVGTYMYLDQSLNDDLEREFKRLDFELDEHLEFELEKNRDFYNLVVSAGLQRIEQLDSEELASQLFARRNL